MRKYNPKNERIKRDHYEWQKEANKKSDKTIDVIRQAIDRYELLMKYEDFKSFNKHKAIAFKRHLLNTRGKSSDKVLSKATVLTILRHLKGFFTWLAYQKGYKRIELNQIEYFNLTEKEERVAKGKKLKKYPTIDQIKVVLDSMPDVSEIDKRNKALIAFTILTGMRDSAIASIKLKHVNLEMELVEQIADEVKTKFGKTIYTYFFPVGDDIKQIVVSWIVYLYQVKLFSETDPLFPKTKIIHNDEYEFMPDGVEPVHWNSANQIRRIFRDAFSMANMNYYTPHSFRTTLGRLGEKLCKTPEEFKAWSQNLGHEQVLTTFNSYGQINEHRQGEIIANLNLEDASLRKEDKINEIYKMLKDQNKQST